MKTLRLFVLAFANLLISHPMMAQDAYILIDYMKVKPLDEEKYLSVEQEWKKIHEIRINQGLMEGWQLWRKLYAGSDDSYQFITITWYGSFSQTNSTVPDSIFQKTMTSEQMKSLMERTSSCRIMTRRELANRVMQADNAGDSRYLIVNRMQVTPGMENEYIDMERSIWKPLHEESIKRGLRSHWSVWQTYPYSAGQPRYTTVDGFNDFSSIGTGESTLMRKINRNISWEEIDAKANKARVMVSAEIWELVDELLPAE